MTKTNIHPLSSLRMLLPLLAAILILAACQQRGHRRAHATLKQAEELMNSRPDSALTLLDSLMPHQKAFGKSMRMELMLQHLNAQNKCDTLFRSDSIVKILVDYYANHGTSNQRMLANYLAGRVYYDMGELPMSLQFYLDAIDCADTIQSNCDYATLMRVHSQMGQLYERQFLLEKSLSEYSIAANYALMSEDTIHYITHLNLCGNVYGLMGKVDSALTIKEKAAAMFRHHGQRESAAQTLGSGAVFLIGQGKLAKAKEYIDLYKKESGLFQFDGNIKKGYENYYYTIGLFFLKEQRLDSAEYYFRKLLNTSQAFNDQLCAAQGLCSLYKQLHKTDSVAKYAEYSYSVNDSAYNHINAYYLLQMQAMYDYQRYKQAFFLSEQEKQKAISFSSILLIVLVASLIFGGYRYKVIEKEARLRFERLQLMEKEHRQLMAMRENASSNPLNEEMVSVPPMEVIRETSIYKRIHELQASEDLFEKKLTPKEWKELEREINVAWPLFEDKLYSLYPNLNARQLQVCLLTKIEMKPKMVAEFVQLTEQGVGSLKRRLYEKTFNKKGGTKDFDQSILLI